MAIALSETAKLIDQSPDSKSLISKANKALRRANIWQGDYLPVSCRRGQCSSIVIEFPAVKKFPWNLTNYRKIERIAIQYGLEIEGRWLRRAVTGGTYEYALYIGDSFFRINPFFEKAGEILERIGKEYGMSTK
jgi:hypothetical protein